MFKQNLDELNKHREQTVKDIQELLKNNDRVACIRYTGYGKSHFIIRKLIDEVDGQVIIVVPNDILKIYYGEQYINNKNVIVLTYQIIKNKTTDFIQRNYNNVKLIIADECHHIVADKWTKEFQRLENLTNSKVLGLTATPERIKDRSVVDTFFNGIQVEPLDLIDGISLGFVPKIKYVVAYASLDNRLEKIDRKLTEIDRYKISNLLKVENIIKNYITEEYLKDNLKILVFVSRISFIVEAKYKVYNWFKTLYPNKTIHIYSISSKQTRYKNNKELENFKLEHNTDTIDIMISVDKLIEGLHLPSVSIEIALRKTQSTRIYFQQVGRVINSKQPIVFDLINNASHLYQIKKEYNNSINLTKDLIENNKAKVMFDDCIELIDETKEIEDILRNYNKDINSIIEETIQANLDFIIKSNGKLTRCELWNKLNITSQYQYLVFKSICKNKFNIDYKSKFLDARDELIKKWELYKDEIIENKDGLSRKELAKKLGVSERTFCGFIKKNNIIIKNLPFITTKDVILNNLDYIKTNPDNLSKKQLAYKFNLKEGSFNSAINKMNIEIANVSSNIAIYKTEKQNIDKDINKIIEDLNKGVSYKKISKEYGISDSSLIKYLKDKYNVKSKNNSHELDMEYIKNNPDNLTLDELAKYFGYKGVMAFRYRLIRKNIKQIPYKDTLININYGVRDELLQKVINNKDFIIANTDCMSIAEMSKAIGINETTFKHVLHTLDLPIPNKIKGSSRINEFIQNHIDYIKSNCKSYTISGMAVKLMSFEDGKEFSRSGISDKLKKLNLDFKKNK